MKRMLALLVGTAAATFASAASANTLTPIQTLVASPQNFDRQTVTIAGTVTSVLEMRSGDGSADKPYDMLVVCDGRSCVLAKLGDGNFPDMQGAYINLRGTFSTAKRVGSDVVPQQLVADVFTLSQLPAAVRRLGGG
jgi:hypothetical protein